MNKNEFLFTSGKVIAQKSNGILAVKSIRYASSERYGFPQPFLEDNRYAIVLEKTPVAPQSTFDFLDRMIQKTDVNDFVAEENCQFLSVYRPESVTEPLPIVVWIHGGSYELGCGDLPTTDPTNFIQEQNIIVVTLTYRLGILGFLGNGENRPANLGLLDIIEALKWVQNNATVFGGDPKNVTLLGQSSGGDAIAHLMLVEHSEQWFQKVIIQSAPLGLRKNRAKMTAEFIKKTKFCSEEENLERLVELESKQRPSVFKYGLKAAMPYGTQYGFYPLCRENISAELWRMKAEKFKVLIGYNEDETAFYIKTQPKLKTALNREFGRRMLDKAVKWSTDKIYGIPAKLFAENYKSGGGKIYLFKLKSTVTNHTIGAGHCFDLPLLFGNKQDWYGAGILEEIPWEFIEQNGRKLRNVWGTFIKEGKLPSSDEFPEVLEILDV